MGDETGGSSCGGGTLIATQSHNLVLINVVIESNHLGESCAERGPFHPGEVDPQSVHLLVQLAPDQTVKGTDNQKAHGQEEGASKRH